MQADGRTDMMKLIGAVHECADVHKNSGDMLAVRGAVYDWVLLDTRARQPHLGVQTYCKS